VYRIRLIYTGEFSFVNPFLKRKGAGTLYLTERKVHAMNEQLFQTKESLMPGTQTIDDK
jgi:hypothetical protein